MTWCECCFDNFDRFVCILQKPNLEWAERFVSRGGLDHVIKIFLTIDASHTQPQVCHILSVTLSPVLFFFSNSPVTWFSLSPLFVCLSLYFFCFFYVILINSFIDIFLSHVVFVLFLGYSLWQAKMFCFVVANYLFPHAPNTSNNNNTNTDNSNWLILNNSNNCTNRINNTSNNNKLQGANI